MKLRITPLLMYLHLGLAALGPAVPKADAQTLTVVSGPVSTSVGLIQGSDGNFYVTTDRGGTHGDGAIFQINPRGSLTNLYSFRGRDGADPSAALVEGSDSNFYGTTYSGGPDIESGGDGTVFRITPGGILTNLYFFRGTDGAHPDAGLVRGSDGNFYGTTQSGGTNGEGTVFSINSSGTLTTLYSFCNQPGCPDGQRPMAGLVQGNDGNLYGTTKQGGTSTNCDGGCGAVFKISPSGSLTTLHSFSGTEGAYPYNGVVMGNDGNLYGTTYSGGSEGLGTVFRISPNGTLTSLYSFSGFDGASPFAALVQGSDGNFYGTTSTGGIANLNNEFGSGTIFRMSPTGNLTNLYFFTGDNDGGDPTAPLVQGCDGNFYGATWIGGAFFQLTVPLNPPANQISAIQFFNLFDNMGVGASIPSVAGETYQLQYTDSISPTSWINTGGSLTSIGGPMILIDLAGVLPPQRFYRAVITP